MLIYSLQKLQMTNSKSAPSTSSINTIIPFLNVSGTDQLLYSELSLKIEKLAVLRAWDEVI